MEMPKPGPGHETLKRLAGVWEGEEVMHPSPWDPEGGRATGRTTSRMALGGFALITDYAQERGGAVTYSGHGVWTFDSERERYVLDWFDSMGSPPERFHGRFEGNVLTVAHGGTGMHARLTYDLREPDRLVSRMEMSQGGEAWSTLFDGRYTRVSGANARDAGAGGADAGAANGGRPDAAPGYLSPTQDAGRAFLMRGIEGSVVMLNLLRFRETADYSAHPELGPAGPISGAEAYQRYVEHTLPLLLAEGGEIVFIGEGGDVLIGPPGERWDRVMLIRHRSVEAFMGFASNEAYLAGMGHRDAALADSRLLPLVERE